MRGGEEKVSADLIEFWAQVERGRREGHYYAALFGWRDYDPLHLVGRVRRGVTYAAYSRFQRNAGISSQVLARVVEIPERTLARRKKTGRLDPDESDRLVRLSRVFARALELFEGNVEGAREWLMTPRPALGGCKPIDLAGTDVGAIEVENLIGRIEHGLPA